MVMNKDRSGLRSLKEWGLIMFEDRKKFFSTKKLHALHPKLNVREDAYDGRDYVVFSNPDTDIMANCFPEWPVGLDL